MWVLTATLAFMLAYMVLQSSISSDAMRVETVKLPDNREVLCVRPPKKAGGISCEWANAK